MAHTGLAGWGTSQIALGEVPEPFWKTVAPDVHHEIAEYLFEQVWGTTCMEMCVGNILFERMRGTTCTMRSQSICLNRCGIESV